MVVMCEAPVSASLCANPGGQSGDTLQKRHQDRARLHQEPKNRAEFWAQDGKQRAARSEEDAGPWRRAVGEGGQEEMAVEGAKRSLLPKLKWNNFSSSVLCAGASFFALQAFRARDLQMVPDSRPRRQL